MLFLNSEQKKGSAQLSAHPSPYLLAQVIIKLQWLERVADCSKVREDVARLIYLYLDKYEFVSPFTCTVKKKRRPLSAERLSSLYIHWVAYLIAICKKRLWFKCVFARVRGRL